MRKKNWVSGIIAAGLAVAMSMQSILPVMAEGGAGAGEQELLTEATAELTAEQENSMSAEELGYVPGEILIIYEDGVTPEAVEEKIAEEGDAGQAVIAAQSEEDVSTMAVVKISEDTTVEQAVEAYRQDERVKSAIPNYILESYGDGTGINDPFLSTQSYLQRVEAQGAWNILAKSSHEKVRVAVIDSGIDPQEEDLKNILNPQDSAQIVTRDGQLYAESLQRDGSSDGHGTHISGVLAAQANNGVGIAGVGSAIDNSVVELIMVDIFETDRSKTTSVGHLAAGLRYAKEQGAKVVNLSLGVDRFSRKLSDDQVELLNQVCRELYDAGITIVCAAGNDNYNDNGEIQIIPSDFDTTISVIALDGNNNRWSRSNYGTRKDIAAPGQNIYSTLPGKYGELTGTSMAAPMVTATAAMMYAADSGLTPDEVKNTLQNTATDLGPAGRDQDTGYGIVNARRAVGSVQGLNFDDVWSGLWYYDPVSFVFQRGLMTGLNQRIFGASEDMSRAQYVTILYRMQASPYMEYKQQFADVKNGTFYSDPVTWASAAQVVTGYENGLFGTSDQITREQMALMLYRYAQYLGRDVSVISDLSQFPDKNKVSGFAQQAMQWAVGIGVISGDGGNINPQGNASRAHCATMLQRMIEYYGLD